MNFSKYEFAIDIEKQNQHIRFKQVEEIFKRVIFKKMKTITKTLQKNFLPKVIEEYLLHF